MQEDGNLVVYNGNDWTPQHAVWASGTNGKGKKPHLFVMQADGNAVVYDAHNHPMWASDTWSHKESRAVRIQLTNEGKLQLLNAKGDSVKKL